MGSNGMRLPQGSPCIDFDRAEKPADGNILSTDLLTWIFGNTELDQDKHIYVDVEDPTRYLTARQALTCVRKLICGFKSYNISPGDGVCLLSYNDVFYSMLYMGVVGSGGCVVGANPTHTELELKHLFTISRPKLLIVPPELLKNILPAANECGISPSNILILNVHEKEIPHGFSSWTVLLHSGESDWIRFNEEKLAKRTTAALMCTSGTSGLPKIAAMSHHALIAMNIQACDSKRKPYKISRLICLPQYHSYVLSFSLIAPLREGSTAYLMRRFSLPKCLEAIQRFQITEFPIVPPIVLSIVHSPLATRNVLASLRCVWSAGAPLDKALQKQFARKLSPQASMTQLWGMTETAYITAFMYPERDDTGSVGRLLPNVQARLVDKAGNDISKDGVNGEVLVRSPSIMSSYINNISATQEAFTLDGWLRTGDIAYVRDGKWYIVDRAKELIKVRGWQVAPAELEACLLTHPRVRDAAVIGVTPADHHGEVPRAYVVIDHGTNSDASDSLSQDNDDGATVTEQELKDYLGARLSKYKALAGGVRFVEAIPRGPSGKILRVVIRGWMKDEKGNDGVVGFI